MSDKNTNVDEGSREVLESFRRLEWGLFGEEEYLRRCTSEVLTSHGQSIGLDILEKVSRHRPDILLTTPELGEVIIPILGTNSRVSSRRVVDVLLSSLSAILGIGLSLTNIPYRLGSATWSERTMDVLNRSRAVSLTKTTTKELVKLLCRNLRTFYIRSTTADLQEMKSHLGLISLLFYDKSYKTLVPDLPDILESEKFLALLISLVNCGLKLPRLYLMVLVNNCLELFLAVVPGQQTKIQEEVISHQISNDPREAVECFSSLNSFIYASKFDETKSHVLQFWIQRNQLPEKIMKFTESTQMVEGVRRICAFFCTFAHAYENEINLLHSDSDACTIRQFQNQIQSTGLMKLVMSHAIHLMNKLKDLDTWKLDEHDTWTKIECFEILKTQSHLLSFLKFTLINHPENTKCCELDSFMQSLIEMMEIWELVISHIKDSESLHYGVRTCEMILSLLAILVYYKIKKKRDLLQIPTDRSFLTSGMIFDLLEGLNTIIKDKKLPIHDEVEILNKQIQVLDYLKQYTGLIREVNFDSMKQRWINMIDKSVLLAAERMRSLNETVQDLSMEINDDTLIEKLQRIEGLLQKLQFIDSNDSKFL